MNLQLTGDVHEIRNYKKNDIIVNIWITSIIKGGSSISLMKYLIESCIQRYLCKDFQQK
jgi:hypothetical protein